VATVVVTFSQVVTRYFLHVSLSWSEEVARFLFVWIATLGAAYGFKTKSHFAIVFLVNRFPRRLQKIAGTAVFFLAAAFLIVFVLEALYLILTTTIDQRAPVTQLTMAVPHSAAPVGGTLMLYYLTRNWWNELRSPHQTADEL
jgi:TRAP-type C4-dicarboxylate transport system permease small subunit